MATTMWSRAALIVLAAGLAAGCTSTSEGSPNPATSESTPTIPVSPPSTSAAPEFPERPREIDLTDLDPCEVWTKDQLAELGLRDEPTPDSPSAHPLGGTTCSWYTPREVEPEHMYMVSARPKGLPEFWGDDPSQITESVVDVGGFPAIRETAPEGTRNACGFRVGTAEGQVLTVDLGIFPNEYTVDEACELTLTAAEMAMETLQT